MEQAAAIELEVQLSPAYFQPFQKLFLRPFVPAIYRIFQPPYLLFHQATFLGLQLYFLQALLLDAFAMIGEEVDEISSPDFEVEIG